MKSLLHTTLIITLLNIHLYAQISGNDYRDENSPLINAVYDRDFSKVKSYIEQGADVNETGAFLTTPISAAVETNQLEIVKYLKSKGATDRSGMNKAVSHGDIKMITYLAQNGFKIGTSIVNACENNSVEIVKILVEAGADVNISQKRRRGFLRGKYYVTPIEAAVINNNKEICRYLLANGVSEISAINEAFEKEKNDIIKMIINEYSNVNIDETLMKAFKMKNFEIIEFCIAKGANKNVKDENGKTIFLLAAESGDLNISKYCIEKLGSDPFSISDKGETALMLASSESNLSLIKYLLNLGIDINAANHSGENALYYSLQNEQSDIFFSLVQQNADISKKTNNNSNLLIYAAYKEHLDIVEFLLNKGANPSEENDLGQTVLSFLPEKIYNNKNLIDLLINKGADINKKEYDSGKNMMYYAVDADNFDAVLYLHENGADMNIKDKGGNRPETKNIKIIQFIVNNGFDVDATDGRHDSFLCEAVYSEDLELAQFLIDKGANIDQNCYFNEPPLIKAIKEENLVVIKFLVENGADVNAVGYFDKTVIEYANDNGNEEITAYLKENGAMSKEEKNKFVTEQIKISKAFNKALEEKNLTEIETILNDQNVSFLNVKQIKEVMLISAEKGNLTLIDKMINEYGQTVNSTLNVNNQSILIVAVINNHLNIVNYLADRDADFSQKDYFGKSALDYTKNKEIKKVITEQLKK
jgi:ankyrin repeat protein